MPISKAENAAFLTRRLAGDFGVKSPLAQQWIPRLYQVFHHDETPSFLAARKQWDRCFEHVGGHDPVTLSAKLEGLKTCYSFDEDAPHLPDVLFALHAYYALLLEGLVARALPGKCEKKSLLEADFWEDTPCRLIWGVDSPAITAGVDQTKASLGDRMNGYSPEGLAAPPAAGFDLVGALYQELFPQRLRHRLGEYYTPAWLARHMLDEVGYQGDLATRLLDPTCGSGTFLLQALRRLRARCEREKLPRQEYLAKMLSGVVGFDLNPLAVLAARTNYLFAMADLLEPHGPGPLQLPIYRRDAILDEDALPGGTSDRFDFVVGNPPWIAWDHLPRDYRQATLPLWRRYGLFSLSGREARHGGAKKDLAALVLYRVADRYLRDGGRLGFLITQTLFQTKAAGDGFRRFRLGENGAWLRVVRAGDMIAFQPFPGASNWTGLLVIEKGQPTSYPIPYRKWSLPKRNAKQSNGQTNTADLECLCYQARPVEPARPTSPWFLHREGGKKNLAEPIGPSDYRAHLGANSGGANGVYWVEVLRPCEGGVLVRNLPGKGKRQVPTIEHVIEPELLFPLIRWSNVARYHAVPGAHLLLVQDVHARRGFDEDVMRDRFPRALDYLELFREFLADRAAYRRYQNRAPFYSMYNIGPYTLAPIKVVWRRMDRRINAAVVEPWDDPLLGGRPAVPQETCVQIAVESAEEGHYLCAMFNSEIVNTVATAHTVRGGKGFGSPGMLDYLRLRRFDRADRRCGELAALGQKAHEMVAAGEDVTPIQKEIDRLAAVFHSSSTVPGEW